MPNNKTLSLLKNYVIPSEVEEPAFVSIYSTLIAHLKR